MGGDAGYSDDNLPMNEAGPFKFESDLFSGCCYLRLADTSDVPKDYFKGKRRKMQAVVQGQFKKPMNLSEVMTGQALNRPLKGIPHPTIVKAAQKIIRALSPGVQFDMSSDSPYAISPLAGTAQVLDVSREGEEPDVRSEIQENTRLLGGAFVADPGMTSAQRKRFLSNKADAEKFTFQPDLVYTFDFYQDRMNAATWTVDMTFKQFKLINHLNRQPVQLMAMTQDRHFLYNFEIWHESLLDENFVKKCEESANTEENLTEEEIEKLQRAEV
ncbi:uncharacterized protein LOC135807336 [Sycon ciliatum]|uniref:uncharacterized protein LOC135807336 n=1 Tax=Sycon ciliatum TaxID=27933 RepID=UPI0031F622C8